MVIVVNNNRSLNQEISPYMRAYGTRSPGVITSSGISRMSAWPSSQPIWGVLRLRVTEPRQIGATIARAFAPGRPTLIDAVTDRDVFAPCVR